MTIDKQPSCAALQRRLERALAAHRALVSHIGLGLYRCDRSGRLIAANEALAKLFGYPDPRSLLKQEPFALFDRQTVPGRRELLHEQLLAGATCSNVVSQLRRQDGSPLWVSEDARASQLPGGRPRIEGMLHDLSAKLMAEDELLHACLYDNLTGLPSRGILLDRLEQALRRSQREPEKTCALLVLDLDRLALVNEGLGHSAGDSVLVELARRLRSCLRPADTVARLGGDEFAVLLEDVLGQAEAKAVALRILDALRRPIQLKGEELDPSFSAGLSLGMPDSEPAVLLRDANSARLRAKRQGGGLALFEAPMHEDAARRMAIEHGLRRAVLRDELRVVFQPIVELGQGRLRGFEALVRWRHPRLGELRPDHFIPIAEQTGLIEGLGARVLEVACARLQAWRDEAPAGPTPFVSVNLSPRQLLSKGLPSLVAETLARHRLGPGSLKLEITEGLMVQEPQRCLAVLETLCSLGAMIWLDDFGTGYSNLGSLAQFPLHGIKLDRSFVKDLEHSPRAREVLIATLALAKRLRLSTVGEGVETPEQARLLLDAGCGLGQGYLYARPLEDQEARLYLFQGKLGSAPF